MTRKWRPLVPMLETIQEAMAVSTRHEEDKVKLELKQRVAEVRLHIGSKRKMADGV